MTELRMALVRGVDPEVEEIVSFTKFVALYSYSMENVSWIKTKIEGTLQIYIRSTHPKYVMSILNKKSRDNFKEALTSKCDAQLKDPFVLFRNDSDEILGIWFNEKDDVAQVFETLKVIITKLGQEVMEQQRQQGDFMSMLSKARGDFETKHESHNDDESSSALHEQTSYFSSRVPDHETTSDLHGSNCALPESNSAVQEHNASESDTSVQVLNSSSSRESDFMKTDITDELLSMTFSNSAFKKKETGVANSNNSAFKKKETSVANSNITTETLFAMAGGVSTTHKNDQILSQLFEFAASKGGQATVDSTGPAVPIAIPRGGPVIGSPPSLPTTGRMSLQELEGKLQNPQQPNAKSDVPLIDLFPNLPCEAAQAFEQSQAIVNNEPIVPSANNNHQSALLSAFGVIDGGVINNAAVAPNYRGVNNGSVVSNSGLNSALVNNCHKPLIPMLSTQSIVRPSSIMQPTAGANINHTSAVNILHPSEANIHPTRTNIHPSITNIIHPPAGFNIAHPPAGFNIAHPPGFSGLPNDVYHTRPTLTHDQFALALKHALTKEDFVAQLYAAYREVSALHEDS